MSGNLLITPSVEQSLDAFARRASELLGCGLFEERQSAQYVGDRYFQCTVFGMELSLSLSDESDFKADFRVHFELNELYVTNKTFCDLLADYIARIFAMEGFQVIRPLDFGKIGSPATIYRRDSNEPQQGSRRLVVETVKNENRPLFSSPDLIPRLMKEFGYTLPTAEKLAVKLCSMNTEISASFWKWWNTGIEEDILSINGYNVSRLCQEFDLNPVAAFSTLDWMSREPELALKTLRRNDSVS